MGEVKRERKDSDTNANGQDDGYEYQERMGREMTSQQDNQAHKSGVQSSPDRRRSEPGPYTDLGFKSGGAATLKSMSGNLGDYRDATVFSDEGPSPLGMLSCGS